MPIEISNFPTIWCYMAPNSLSKDGCVPICALQHKLLTRDRLNQFGIVQERACILCKQDLESHDHLLFTSQFSQYLWQLCKIKLGMQGTSAGSLAEEALWIQQQFKERNQLFILSRVVLSGVVWHIWQERNRRIFHHQELSKIIIFRRLYEDILVLMWNCYWKIDNGINNKIILSNWG